MYHTRLWSSPRFANWLWLIHCLPFERNLELTLLVTGGHLHHYSTERPALHQTHSTQFVKAHMSAVESDSDPKLARDETREWGVSQPLAFVNWMSRIILARTVNWERSRGFAVLMSFPWTQVILWILEESLQLLIFEGIWSQPHLYACLSELAQRGKAVLLKAWRQLSFSLTLGFFFICASFAF